MEPGGDVDQVGVDREVGQAATVGEERLPRVAVALVLADGVADVLPGERVLELGGKERQAVEEEHQVEARVVLLAVAELAHHGEEVAAVEAFELLVEAA